jgi:UDP-hydrolysing UDP-N-acetyl-D-glucosamine 2-epimerase
MGEDPATVFKTGCPSIDLADSILRDPKLDFDPLVKYGGVGLTLDISEGYLVVMQHPVTTEYERAQAQIEETLHAVHELGIPALWFWPNVDAGTDGISKGIRVFRERERLPHIHFFRNMTPEDFLKLAYNSQVIVGNSSAAIRECAYLGVPAVNIGTRQAGRERGQNVVDVGYDRHEIAEGIEAQLRNGRYPSDPLYGDGYAGPRIAELLATQSLTIEKRLAY